MAIDCSRDGGIVEVNMDADVVPEAQFRAVHSPQQHVPCDQMRYIYIYYKDIWGTLILIEVHILIAKSPSTIGDVGSELNIAWVVLKEVESKPRREVWTQHLCFNFDYLGLKNTNKDKISRSIRHPLCSFSFVMEHNKWKSKHR